jgi:hypothetical protein
MSLDLSSLSSSVKEDNADKILLFPFLEEKIKHSLFPPFKIICSIYSYALTDNIKTTSNYVNDICELPMNIGDLINGNQLIRHFLLDAYYSNALSYVYIKINIESGIDEFDEHCKIQNIQIDRTIKLSNITSVLI